MPTSKAHTGGLDGELHLAIGAKAMLTVNFDLSDGLVNVSSTQLQPRKC